VVISKRKSGYPFQNGCKDRTVGLQTESCLRVKCDLTFFLSLCARAKDNHFAHSRFDFKMSFYTFFIPVISRTTSRMVPGLARTMRRTTQFEYDLLIICTCLIISEDNLIAYRKFTQVVYLCYNINILNFELLSALKGNNSGKTY
jgi:hypothetical protein